MGDYAITDVIGELVDFIVIYFRELTGYAGDFAGITILVMFLVILPMALLMVVALPLAIVAVVTKGFGGKVRMPKL